MTWLINLAYLGSIIYGIFYLSENYTADSKFFFNFFRDRKSYDCHDNNYFFKFNFTGFVLIWLL